MNTRFTAAVEIGGTFTDLVLSRDGQVERTIKVPSTPAAPEVGALAALDELNLRLTDVEVLVHGSTVATNAVLERKGARTALMVTEGFRDILQIQREERSRIYDLQFRKPLPLVPRDRVLAVRERMSVDGTVVIPLDEIMLVQTLQHLATMQVEAIAVCLLHAYANPEHELRVRELIGQHLNIDVVSLSSEVVPEFREYERASTTVLNAYVAGTLKHYIGRMEQGLRERGFAGSFRIVQSNGGVLPAASVAGHAARSVLSGPAAGVIGAIKSAASAGLPNVITFDMGGTSTDVCLVTQGRAHVTTDSKIDGLPVRVPMISIETVGAGGGSIASVDAGRWLRVGPTSAGALPGPACYGRGGQRATVTDANLVLGRIRPRQFFGGKMVLDVPAAYAAISELSPALGCGTEEAAESIVRVANATMAQTIRLISVERGYDPRDYVLLAFGGAGPLHVVALAEELEIDHVFVPRNPGVLSAYGLMVADFRRDYVRTEVRRASETSWSALQAVVQEMEARALNELAEYRVAAASRSVDFHVDMRYEGQAFELPVRCSPGDGIENLPALVAAFHEAHAVRYGHSSEHDEVELVNFRLTVSVPQDAFALAPPPTGNASTPGTGQIYANGSWHAAQFFERSLLRKGTPLRGPCVIEEQSATTYIPLGWRGEVDANGHIHISRERI